MSWTSENDPPPPRPVTSGPETDSEPTPNTADSDSGRPTDADDVPSDYLGDEVEETTDSSESVLNDLSELGELNDDEYDESVGLDPSVFDGLFDDLGQDPEPESEAEAFYQTGELDELGYASDGFGERQAIDGLSDEETTIFVADDSEVDDFAIAGLGSIDPRSTEIGPADIEPTDVESTDFEATNAQLADVESTDFESTDSESTDFESTDFESTDFESTDFESTDFESTDFRLTNFESADFESSDAELTSADQADAELPGTEPADIERTDAESLRLDYRRIPVPTGDDFDQDEPIDVGFDGSDPIDKYFPEQSPTLSPNSIGVDDRWTLPSTQVGAEHVYVGEQQRVTKQPEIGYRQQDYYERGPAVQLRAPVEAPARRRRRANWAGILVAVTIGSVLGLVGTFLISDFRDSDEDSNAEGQANQGVASSQAGPQGQGGISTEPGNSGGQGANGERVVQPFGISAVQFVDGTPNLAEEDRLALDKLAELLIGNREAAATVTVRSYSAITSAANYELSVTQSNTISQYLEGLGVSSEQLAVSARGAAPFSPSQPVNGFVVVSPGIGQTGFKLALGQINPFVIGLEPGSSNLREESITALERVGEAMNTVETAEITLAAYSYTESGTETNAARSAQAAQVASQYLQTAYAIDEARIATIPAGNVPYKMDPEWGSHVEIRVEEGTKPAFNISSLDSSQLTFEPNSSRLSFEGRTFLDQVSNALGSSNATLIVDVFSYASADGQVNDQLSKAQAQAITDYLASKDVSGLQARFSGSGSSPQFESLGAPTVVALTVSS